MTKVVRLYNAKDVEVLVVGETIAENAKTLVAALTLSRPQWADPYFDDLITEIQGVYTTALGIDNAKDMREATYALYALMPPAYDALAMFKVQVEIDYAANKDRQNEILNQLGYKQHYAGLRKGDQESFVEILAKFKVNMTPTLITELNAAGIPTVVINKVTNFSDSLKNANITQEVAKGMRKNISEEAVGQINSIYQKVMAISKIGAKVFKNDKTNKDRLNFTANLKQLNFHSKKNLPSPPNP